VRATHVTGDKGLGGVLGALSTGLAVAKAHETGKRSECFHRVNVSGLRCSCNCTLDGTEVELDALKSGRSVERSEGESGRVDALRVGHRAASPGT